MYTNNSYEKNEKNDEISVLFNTKLKSAEKFLSNDFGINRDRLEFLYNGFFVNLDENSNLFKVNPVVNIKLINGDTEFNTYGYYGNNWLSISNDLDFRRVRLKNETSAEPCFITNKTVYWDAYYENNGVIKESGANMWFIINTGNIVCYKNYKTALQHGMFYPVFPVNHESENPYFINSAKKASVMFSNVWNLHKNDNQEKLNEMLIRGLSII